MYLFVYGTLLKGCNVHHLLTDAVKVDNALCTGQLIDLNGYPAMTTGESIIFGELYRVNAELLASIDRYEGCSGYEGETSEYRCEAIPTTLLSSGQQQSSLVYLQNRSAPTQTRLSTGDYRATLTATDEYQWYLAFGSNMNEERLVERVGKPRQTVPCRLPGYRLVFNESPQPGIVHANLQFTVNADSAPCVAYLLHRDQLDLLDSFEQGYYRLVIPFQGADGELLGNIYLARPDRLVTEIAPQPEYLYHVQKGYADNGFSWQRSDLD